MPHKILVVDDEASIVHLLKEDLEQEGYFVVTGFDGQMAIQLAQDHKPDLIILDVNLPHTSGLQAMQAIRRLPQTKNIPIIVLTGEPSANVFPVLEASYRLPTSKNPST